MKSQNPRIPERRDSALLFSFQIAVGYFFPSFPVVVAQVKRGRLGSVKANVAVNGIMEVFEGLGGFDFNVPRYIIVIFKSHPEFIYCHMI